MYQGRKIQDMKLFTLGEPRTWALDIGAHVGLWSRVLSYSYCPVIAFEPIAENVHCWRLNQDHPNITRIYQTALGHKRDPLAMIYEEDHSGHGQIHACGNRTVEMTTLTRWYENNKDDLKFIEPGGGFIKIDVEGYEEKVLRGGEEFIRTMKPFIFVEQKETWPEFFGLKTGGAVKLLESWGMEVIYCRAGDYLLEWK